MAEYRIVAKIDPQTGAGAQKVKQDLRGIQTEGAATEKALNGAFDQAKFDKTIGALISRLESLDGTMKGVQSTTTALSKSNATLGQSLDQMALSMGKATNTTKGQGQAADDAKNKNLQLEAALRRVLQATDAEAAEQQKLNALLADAKRLLDAGKISQEQYAKVQQMAANEGKNLTAQTGAQRIGMQQLWFQLGDIATMYSLGAKPAQIFASQIGQVTQAIQLMSGGGSKWAAFLGGPWGIALSVGTIILAPFIAKLFESNDALADGIDKLNKDAKATDDSRKAKEAWLRTVEGQIARQKELNRELDKSILTQNQQQSNTLMGVNRNIYNQLQSRDRLQGQLPGAERAAADARNALLNPTFGTDPAMIAGLARAAADAEEKVKTLKKQIADLNQSINEGFRARREAQIPIIEREVAASVDAAKGATERYNNELGRLRESYAAGNITQAKFRSESERIQKQLEKETKAAQEANRAHSDGVARFKSREQAIGIAGRELQTSGLKVSENEQFGGVKANHPGMGASHGKYAVDVNSGSGIVEANVPELKSKFDAMARRYQARGYRVLWNGWVYEANGDGPTKRIPAGQNQHNDHMHLEAPATIVGKATQAGTEGEARREDAQQEKASDFIQGIVDTNLAKGLPNNDQAQTNAQIDKALAEFKRRFDRVATPSEEKVIRESFTDADARDTARRFDEAYVKPLERLQALQGKTGIDRDIMNAKLNETARLGRELTPIEAQQIENGIRRGDQLTREAQILEQIRGPMDEYKKTLEVLNALLAKGEISQASFNARVAELGSTATSGLKDLPGVDPKTGKAYADISAESDENTRYAKQLEDFAAHREQLLQMGIDYDALVETAHQEHQNRMAAIDQARKDVQLSSAQDIFGSLTSIAETMAGKQSAIYKAMFAAEKAVAIARSIMAIQTGIAQASALPFPANLGAIASVVAATASIVSNIRAVTLNFKDGGLVRGPGGPRSDSVPVNASNGEFIVNARATAENKPLLEAINSGKTIRAAERQMVMTAADTANRAAAQPGPVQANLNARFINLIDPNMIADFFGTPEGERVFVNLIRGNSESVQKIAAGGS